MNVSTAGAKEAGPTRGLATLVGLAIVLASAGWALVSLVGAPDGLPSLPSWDEVSLLARGPMLSFTALRPFLVLGLWLLWSWVTLSFVLSLGLEVAERIASGAAWVATLRAMTAMLACPPVRQAVHGALATLFAISVATRSVTPVAAAPMMTTHTVERVVDVPPAAVVLAPALPPIAPASAGPIAATAPSHAPAEERRTVAPPSVMRHTVAPGECLSRIAEWYRDDWTAYPAIARDPANHIANPNLIYPGQVIVVHDAVRTTPMPTVVAPPTGGEQTYRVRPGDTLRQIAATIYGDTRHVDAIYERNWAAIPNPHQLFWGTTLALPIIPEAASGPRALPPAAEAGQPAPAAPAVSAPSAVTPTPPVDRWATDPRSATAQPLAAPVTSPSAPVVGPIASPTGGLVPIGPELRQEPLALAEELARRADQATQPGAVQLPARAPGFVSVAQEFGQDRAAQALLAAAVALAIGGSLTIARARPHWLRARRRGVVGGDDRVLADAVGELEAERARVRQGLAGPPTATGTTATTGAQPLAASAPPGPEPGGWWSLERLARLFGPETETPSDGRAERAVAARPASPSQPVAMAAVAGHLLAGLADAGITSLQLLAARASAGRIAFLLAGPLADQARLATLAPDLAAAVGATAETEPTPAGDVLVALVGPVIVSRPVLDAAPCLIPVGVVAATGRARRPGGPRDDDEVLALGLPATGHLLIAGQPDVGVDIVLTGVLAALAARLSPAALGLRLVAAAHTLPADLALLPHHLTRAIEPTNLAALDQLMAGLHHELARRITLRRQVTSEPPPRFPLLVVAIAELAHLPLAAIDQLRVLAGEGPAHGIVLLAATSRLATLADGYRDLFATTLALRVADEATSIRLLGVPDAATLVEAGELVVALAGRPPIRATGVQVTDEQLRTLAERLIAGTVDDPAAAPPATPRAASHIVEEPAELAGPDEPDLHTDAVDQDDDERAPAGGGPDHSAAMTGSGVAIITPDEPARASVVHPTVGPDAAKVDQAVVIGGPPLPIGAAAELGQTGPLVVIECLGALRVLAGDRVLEPAGQQPGGQRRANQYAWEALAVLAACPEGEASLWTVARALYPDEVDAVDEAYLLKRARTALNDARAFLRHQVTELQGMLILHRGGGEGGRYRLDWTQITSDAREFREGLTRARREAALPAATTLGRALGHYRGHLLADRPPGGWPDELRVGGVHSSLRAYYSQLWGEAMGQLGRLCLQLGQPDQAATVFRRLFEQEPDEAVAEQLLRAYEAVGAARGAVRAVQADWTWIGDRLREELDAEPTPELQATYTAVITALGGQPLSTSPTSLRRRTGPLPLIRPPIIGVRIDVDTAAPTTPTTPDEAHPAQA